MADSGFKGIGIYITRRQNMVAQYIATRPILDLCERSARRPGVRVSRRLWELDSLDLEGSKKRSAAAVALDVGETIGEEEGITIETTTVQERGRGYKVET